MPPLPPPLGLPYRERGVGVGYGFAQKCKKIEGGGSPNGSQPKSSRNLVSSVRMSASANSSVSAIQESLKGASVQELLSFIGAAAAEAKKKAKGVKEKSPKEPKEKGPVPPQLRIPHAWVAETLRDSNANGWEEFQVAGGDVVPASTLKDGVHAFADGKKMNHKLAMSLSKQRWAPKTQIGTHKAKYEAFLLAFQASDAAVVTALAVPATAEPKAAAAPKAPKAAAAPKAAVPAASAVVPAASAVVPKAKASPKKAPAAAASPKKTKANTWTCDDDGNVHPWEFKGKKYARNFQNQVWEATADGEISEWAGIFDGKKIDASAEPLYLEDE